MFTTRQKKDVVEFKRIKPCETLIDPKVEKFVKEKTFEIWNEYNGYNGTNIEILNHDKKLSRKQ